MLLVIFVIDPIRRSIATFRPIGPISLDKTRDHARGVYPTQDTSRMRPVRVKQEKEADTRIIVKEE